MELVCLNSRFEPVSMITYINLQWNRKYYECGQFSLQILAKDYSTDIVYIYTKERREVGIVHKVEFDSKINGDFVQLSGFFLEKLLDNAIMFPKYNYSGSVELCARDIITRFCGDIEQLKLGSLKNINTPIEVEEEGANVGKCLYSLLESLQMSYRLDFNYNSNEIEFNIWQGLNRTQEQSVNNFLVFSKDWGSLKDTTITKDSSNEKNFAIIAGEGEGADRIYTTLNRANGLPIKKIFVDAKDVKKGDMGIEKYYEALKSKGYEKLKSYGSVTNTNFSLVSDSFTYLEDYDLGDKCDVIVNDIDFTFQARIIEINEVIKQNKVEIEITVGDKIPTVYSKMKMGGI